LDVGTAMFMLPPNCAGVPALKLDGTPVSPTVQQELSAALAAAAGTRSPTPTSTAVAIANIARRGICPVPFGHIGETRRRIAPTLRRCVSAGKPIFRR
jgi:hypothetical protein